MLVSQSAEAFKLVSKSQLFIDTKLPISHHKLLNEQLFGLTALFFLEGIEWKLFCNFNVSLHQANSLNQYCFRLWGSWVFIQLIDALFQCFLILVTDRKASSCFLCLAMKINQRISSTQRWLQTTFFQTLTGSFASIWLIFLFFWEKSCTPQLFERWLAII